MPETRKIILIDEERCDGCGQCVTAYEDASPARTLGEGVSP